MPARSACRQEPDRLVPLEQVEQYAQRLAARTGELGILVEHQLRVIARSAVLALKKVHTLSDQLRLWVKQKPVI